MRGKYMVEATLETGREESFRRNTEAEARNVAKTIVAHRIRIGGRATAKVLTPQGRLITIVTERSLQREEQEAGCEA